MLNLVANGSSTGYTISNSLRFRSSASAYLSRTFTTPTSQNKWTYSAWVKPSLYYSGTYGLFGLNSVSDNNGMGFDGSNNSQFIWFGSSVTFIKTTQVFRDPSAWYHIVLAVDSAATGTNKIRFYVNGSEVTSFSSDGRSSFSSSNINTASVHAIGRRQWDGTQYYDGYETEVYFVDGQQLTPSSFGSTNSTTGVWQPAKYTGTYGTNGFYLKFSNIALTSGSNTGLGQDFSGNGNYWNTNNISVTAGTTYDAMTDVPTLTSATVANYAVLNAVNTASNTITDGNLKTSFSAVGGNRSTIGMSSGKWYWEVSPTTCPSFTEIGIVSSSVAITGDISASNAISYMSHTGYWWRNNVGTAYGATYTTTDVIGIAVDIDNNTITFYKNGTSQGAITSVTLNTDTWFACMGNAAASATVGIYNFGQRPFTYTPPTGFVALNTYNL